MSIYGMVMPPNPVLGALVMAAFTEESIMDEMIVSIPKEGLGRVRDAWVPEGKGTICILHRNYGEADVFTEQVAKSKNYVGYHAWEGDNTYAWWEFDIPDFDVIKQTIYLIITSVDGVGRHPMERYLEIIENMGDPDKAEDPDVQRAVTAGEQIMAGVADSIESGTSKEVTTPQGSVKILAITPNDKIKGNRHGR